MKILSVVTLAFAVSACNTLDPYTGESKTSNTAKGAGIGAIAGAVLGAATSSKSDRKKGLARGAAIGGLIGGGVGNYMDRQEAQLRQQLAGSGVQVMRDGDNIRLIMPGNITFASARSVIRTDFYDVLDSVSLVLKEYKNTSILVAGHTDSTGGASMNQTLSEQRALSVKGYLQSAGIPAGRVRASGYGPRYPIADNGSSGGRQQNRRVELTLEPLR